MLINRNNNFIHKEGDEGSFSVHAIYVLLLCNHYDMLHFEQTGKITTRRCPVLSEWLLFSLQLCYLLLQ